MWDDLALFLLGLVCRAAGVAQAVTPSPEPVYINPLDQLEANLDFAVWASHFQWESGLESEDKDIGYEASKKSRKLDIKKLNEELDAARAEYEEKARLITGHKRPLAN